MSQSVSEVLQTCSTYPPLPQSWRWAKLEEVCEVVTGSTPPKQESRFYGGTIPWIKPDDLDKTLYVDSSSEYLSDEGAKVARLLPAGSVLISCIGNIGKAAIAGCKLATNQQINALVPGDNVDSLYLFYAAKSIAEDLRTAASVSLVPILNKSAFSASRIPLAPINEQRQIAEALFQRMEAVRRSRDAAEAQLAAAKSLPYAFLREAFLGIIPLTVNPIFNEAPEGWRWRKLTDLARLESGHTPSRYHPEWWLGDIPWIALPDIRALDGKIAFETSEYTNADGIANSAARVLPARTVVLSRTASVGFVTIMGRPMATSQDFVNWVCGDELDPHFLALLLRASRKFIHSVSSGAVHKTVYMPTVESFRVCIPALDVQRRIATETLEKLQHAEQLVFSLTDNLEAIGKLPAALLREAFSGKI